MRKSLKAMSLIETMVAMCVSTMLLLSLGAAFFMFKELNSNTIKNSKKELAMMSVRDYIENNIDEIVTKEINGTAFYVNVNELKSSYTIYKYEHHDVVEYYLVSPDDVSKFLRNYSGSIPMIDYYFDIRLFNEVSEEHEPILTINGDYVIKFNDIIRYEGDYGGIHYDIEPSYFLVDYNDKVDNIAPIYRFTDYRLLSEDEKQYYDEIGESIYYSNLYNSSNLFEDIFTYDATTGNLMVRGKEKPIFEKLPYKSLSITLSLTSDTYRIVDRNGKLMPTYGVEVLPDNQDHGVAYVSDVDYYNRLATITAKEITVIGNKLADNPFSLDDEDSEVEIEDVEDGYLPEVIDENVTYSFKFVGWISSKDKELYLHNNQFTNKEIKVALPEDGEKISYIAVYEPQLSECTAGMDERVDQEYRYTYSQKELFVIHCDIDYVEKIEGAGDSVQEEGKRVNFIPGIYYKYIPEVYTGIKE